MKNDTNIGERLREERVRISPSQEAFANLCDVSRGTVVAWEKGAQFPNAEVLRRLADAGVDVLYIVTGKRDAQASATLSVEESLLVARLRQGSPILRGYLQEAAGVLKTGNAVTIGGDVGQSIAGDASFSAPVSFGTPKARK